MKSINMNFEYCGIIENKIYSKINYYNKKFIDNNENDFNIIPRSIKWAI